MIYQMQNVEYTNVYVKVQVLGYNVHFFVFLRKGLIDFLCQISHRKVHLTIKFLFPFIVYYHIFNVHSEDEIH